MQGSVGVLIPLSKTENVIINSPKLNRRSSLITSTKPTFIEVKELHSGDSFGELALISNKVRASSIVCKEDCHFAYLEKKGFEAVLLDLEKQKLMEGLNFLEKIPIFNNVIQKTLLSLYFGFQSKKFSKGNIIYKENSIPTSVFLIKDGEFLVFLKKV